MTGRLEFRIHGMDCADEVAILRREIEPLVGGPDRLTFDLLRGRMTVRGEQPAVEVEAIIDAVARSGMRAERWTDAHARTDTDGRRRLARIGTTTASGALTGIGFALHAAREGLLAAVGAEGTGLGMPTPAVVAAIYTGAIVSGGWFIVPRAWQAARRLRPDMHLLMTIAVLGAVAIGEWLEGAVVTFLFALSLALESWSVGRARRAVEALLAIAPPTARLLGDDGTAVEVPAGDVDVGQRILVKPGDRVPLDGFVREGVSEVNQAPITGESAPVDKAPGSDVFAGTINGSGVLQVEVSRAAGDTTLAHIIRMVGDAQSRRAPSEQWVDRFARVYTPAIFGLAVLVATVPPLVAGGAWADWFYSALVLLVIGCPCALVISTPVAIVASLAAAARQGVLLKGGAFAEVPARLRAVALDKTGTLTKGAPTVSAVVPLAGHTEAELLQAMGAVEAHSDHPLARAIVAYVRDRGLPVTAAADVRALDGRGVTARLDGREYWLGSHRYLEELGTETPEVHQQLNALSDAGHSVVIMGTDNHVCGFVTLADAVRPESRAAVAALREAGIAHVVMLTGDNRATAERIAAETGISELRAELLPAEKVAAVEELVQRFGTVAMIGDGVNDAPAMGRASLGIAMGAAGSDAAIEAADVALMSDDLSRLAWLVRHSRRTLAIIRQNVVLALAVKLIFVVLTFTGQAALWAAIAADMGVSLVVIANALRLLGPGAPVTTRR